MEATKILSSDLLDILFENRNKDYGAYYLRRTYNKRILRALIITASVALSVFLGLVMASSISKKNTNFKIDELNLQNIKQDDKKIETPVIPPKKEEMPKIETKIFTTPIVKNNDEVKSPPPEQTDLTKAMIGDINQKGVEYTGIATPSEIDDNKKVIEEKKDPDEPFWKVEIEAKFKGGDAEWAKYLRRYLNGDVPAENGAPAGSYNVIIQFIVDKDGMISDAKPLTNFGYGMEEEAMRVIKKSPAWEAAVQNGRKVKAYHKQPITFQISAE